MICKTYSELILLPTFEERLEYLKLDGVVGQETFGQYRYVNQQFYKSNFWQNYIRPIVIDRDFGCDLGVRGYDIKSGPIFVHHMNPITIDDIINRTPRAIDPEYLITMSLDTHNLLHYGKDLVHPVYYTERKPNDTCPWRLSCTKAFSNQSG